MTKKILCPVDGTDHAEVGSRHAVATAKLTAAGAAKAAATKKADAVKASVVKKAPAAPPKVAAEAKKPYTPKAKKK